MDPWLFREKERQRKRGEIEREMGGRGNISHSTYSLIIHNNPYDTGELEGEGQTSQFVDTRQLMTNSLLLAAAVQHLAVLC